MSPRDGYSLKTNPFFGIVVACALVLVVALLCAAPGGTAMQEVRAQDEAQQAPEALAGQPTAAGNLQIMKFNLGGASAGYPTAFSLMYGWFGDGPAPNAQVVDTLPPGITFVAAVPPPSNQSGSTLVWDLGTLESGAWDAIILSGTVSAGLADGSVVTNTATIDADITDENPDDNTYECAVTVQKPKPDLWLFKWGALEEYREDLLWMGEKDVEQSFDIYFFNLSSFEAPNTTLVDELPAGIEYVSAWPEPNNVAGQQLTWDVGTVEGLGAGEFGQVTLRVRPVQTGTFTNNATITTTEEDRDPSDNSASYTFDVMQVLPPRLLKPNTSDLASGAALIVGPNPRLEGLARSGATVTIYEGDEDGCWGDFSGCNPVLLGMTTAGADRRWVFTPTTMTDTRTYAIYLRAEFEGVADEGAYGRWSPALLRVDPEFTDAGWDFDNFVVETGGYESRPGGLGGTTGALPGDEISLNIRQEIWDSVPTSPTLAANHDMQVVVVDDTGRSTSTLPVAEFQRVTTSTSGSADLSAIAAPAGRWGYDLKYRMEVPFPNGTLVEFWCRPVYYPDDPNDLPIVGLVFVPCHKIAIDPAGYVYDLSTTSVPYEWPEVPPSDALITNATVTATVRAGDNAWAVWDAEEMGQINPQVTDATTADGIRVQGYYAFYVPPGQYQVLASAPDCAVYRSPILTVVDEPIFHNVGMRCGSSAQVGVRHRVYLPVVMR